MTGADALSIIIAALILPLLTAVFTRPNMSANTKRIISVVVAAVLGALSALISGQLDFVPPDVSVWVVRVLVWMATVALAGQAAYKLLNDPAKAIEAATTSSRSPEGPTSV